MNAILQYHSNLVMDVSQVAVRKVEYVEISF